MEQNKDQNGAVRGEAVDALPARRFVHVTGFVDADYVEFKAGQNYGGGVFGGAERESKHYTREDAEECVRNGAWREVGAISALSADAPSEPSELAETIRQLRNIASEDVTPYFCTNVPKDLLHRAADALDSQPTEWLPTAAAINALPEGVRKYIHNLVANSDPAGTVAHNTLLTDNCENLQVAYRKMADALEEVRACFSAAEAEGLSTALAETSDEGLKDLVERRLMHAFYVAEPFSSQPTDGGVRNG